MANVNELLQKLHGLIQDEDTAGILGTADQILKQTPNDQDVLMVKLVALLQDSQYEAAVALFKKQQDLAKKYAFEHAYALYRVKRHTAALSTLTSMPASNKHAGHHHLEAQVNYRLGNFARAVQIYEENFSVDEMDEEMKTNLLAAYVSGGMYAKAIAMMAKSSSSSTEGSYELSYNTACALIEAGQLAQAQIKLEQAMALCKVSLQSESASAAEIADESAAIRAQQALVWHRLQQTQRAREIYAEMAESKISDTSVTACVLNNLLALPANTGAKSNESYRRQWSNLSLSDEKLSLKQKQVLSANRCIMMLMNAKGSKALEQIKTLQQEQPDSELPVLLLAALYHRQKQSEQCLAVLNEFIRAHPTASLQCRLALAHLALLAKDASTAIAQLRGMEGHANRPAFVATLCALYESLKQSEQVTSTMNKAIDYWSEAEKENKDSNASSILLTLRENYAVFLMRHKLYKEAATVWEAIVNNQGSSALPQSDRLRALSQLVLCCARFDPVLAQQHAAKLPRGDEEDGEDAKELEKLGAPRKEKSSKRKEREEPADKAQPSASTSASSAASASSSSSTPAKKKARKHKIRLPKNFDPSNPGPLPDPDRWLPRWERQAKKGKKSKKHDVSKGSQGAVLKGADEGLDATLNVGKEEKKAAAPVPPPAAASRAQRGGRKKGRR